MMLKKLTTTKSFRHLVQGLPLAGILVTSLLPLSVLGRQLLMLVLLLWFQAYFIFDVFFNGK